MTRTTQGALAITLACIAAPASAQYTPLFVIPVESASKVTLPAGTAARVRLTGTDTTLGAALGVKATDGAMAFEYIIDAYPQLQARRPRTWLEPTFVIDFDEPVFAEVAGRDEGSGRRSRNASHWLPSSIASSTRRVRAAGIWLPRSPDAAKETAPNMRC